MTFAGETGNWTDTVVYLRRSKQIIFSANLPLGARYFPKSLTLGGEDGGVGGGVQWRVGWVKGKVRSSHSSSSLSSPPVPFRSLSSYFSDVSFSL